jgi:hypothetical protein
VSLSFREYLLQRPPCYTATSSFVLEMMRDDEFSAITTREELDRYLDHRQIGPNGRIHANEVWLSYLNAKKRHRRKAAGTV